MIHLPTWLQRHSLEIAPRSLVHYEGLTLIEADVAIITRACPKRIVWLEGRDTYDRSESHRIAMSGMLLDVEAVARFYTSARAWLNLPIQELGYTRFAGDHEFGFISQDRLTLRFQQYLQTPSKTDWMTVDIDYVNGENHGTKVIHVDYTCLEEFVSGWECWSDAQGNALPRSSRATAGAKTPPA
jgi:hypothetical protein